MTKRRITIAFDMENALHKRIFDQLNTAMPGARNQYVISLIAQALDMEKSIYEGVKRAISESGAILRTSDVRDGEIPDDMMDFLSTL